MRIVIPANGAGNQIIRSKHRKVYEIYEGVHVEFQGYYDCTGPNCSITLTLEPHEALCFALDLLRAVDKHGKTTQANVKSAVRRYANTLEKSK